MTIHASCCGDIQLLDNIVILNVLLVLRFKFNIISVRALTKESSVNVLFSQYNFEIHDMTTFKTIGRGERQDDLYVLPSPSSTIHVNKVSSQIWHDRLPLILSIVTYGVLTQLLLEQVIDTFLS